jgi:hypothetical protein
VLSHPCHLKGGLSLHHCPSLCIGRGTDVPTCRPRWGRYSHSGTPQCPPWRPKSGQARSLRCVLELGVTQLDVSCGLYGGNQAGFLLVGQGTAGYRVGQRSVSVQPVCWGTRRRSSWWDRGQLATGARMQDRCASGGGVLGVGSKSLQPGQPCGPGAAPWLALLLGQPCGSQGGEALPGQACLARPSSWVRRQECCCVVQSGGSCPAPQALGRSGLQTLHPWFLNSATRWTGPGELGWDLGSCYN